MWDSDLGKAATGESLEGWRQASRKYILSHRSDSKSEAKDKSRLKTTSILMTKPDSRFAGRRSLPKEASRPFNEWFAGEDKENPLSNAISIPVLEMNRLWSGGTVTCTKENDVSPDAKEAMEKVHVAMQRLRACYTETAVEKSSIDVAAAMLHLLSIRGACQNPFLCLQQAAIFASHGTKRGSSDSLFRGRLPKLFDCTPDEALVILGRADCLHAVHFPHEAAYLCSYVARLCGLHRQSGSTTPLEEPSNERAGANDKHTKLDHQVAGWNNQWLLLSVLCYNVSIMIRSTVKQALDECQFTKKEEFDPWDQDVIDELLLGRKDALAWKESLNKKEVFHGSCADSETGNVASVCECSSNE